MYLRCVINDISLRKNAILHLKKKKKLDAVEIRTLDPGVSDRTLYPLSYPGWLLVGFLGHS